MKSPIVWGVMISLAAVGGTAAYFLGAEAKKVGRGGETEQARAVPVAAGAPAAVQGRAAGTGGATSKLQGQWQHVDTRFKFTCTGSPEKEKEAKGESFTIGQGRAPGELQYSDRSCSLRLGVVGDQASVLPDQSCGAENAFHYEVLTVTLSGEDVAKLEGRGVFRIDTQDKLVECSFQTTGTAKKMQS